MTALLRQAPCPLCHSDAAIAPAMVPGGGVRANRLAVSCPKCKGFLIETSLRDIPFAVRAILSATVQERYREDGSVCIEITSGMVRTMTGATS